jgi:hypothetical protein
MKKVLLAAGTTLFLLSISLSFAVRHAQGQVDDSVAATTDANFVAPAVFQAAGPSPNSIQSVVTDFRPLSAETTIITMELMATGAVKSTGMAATLRT